MVIFSFSANNNVSKFFSNKHVFWERGSTLVANSFPLRLRVDSVRSHLYLCMYTTSYPQTGWCCRTVGAEHQRTGPIRPLQRAESTGWGAFSSQKFSPKNFHISFKHMYEALNVIK